MARHCRGRRDFLFLSSLYCTPGSDSIRKEVGITN